MPGTQKTAERGVVVIDVKVGQQIRLQSVDFGEICLTIGRKDGQRVRVGVKAGPSVTIGRPEPAVA